jgi:hypothetical protein
MYLIKSKDTATNSPRTATATLVVVYFLSWSASWRVLYLAHARPDNEAHANKGADEVELSREILAGKREIDCIEPSDDDTIS